MTDTEIDPTFSAALRAAAASAREQSSKITKITKITRCRSCGLKDRSAALSSRSARSWIRAPSAVSGALSCRGSGPRTARSDVSNAKNSGPRLVRSPAARPAPIPRPGEHRAADAITHKKAGAVTSSASWRFSTRRHA